MNAPDVRTPGSNPANAAKNTNTAIVTTAKFLFNQEKKFYTLRGRAAWAGVTLRVLENDHGETVYIASRWEMTLELADLDAVASWLNRAVRGRS